MPPAADGAKAGDATRIGRRVGDAFAAVLGDRLVALAAYGSSVDGSFLPGFSDLDLAFFIHGRIEVEDAVGVQRLLQDLGPDPFDYLQAKFADIDEAPRPTLVPGSFAMIRGRIPDPAYIHDETSLRAVGFATLAGVVARIEDDKVPWAIAAGPARRRRLVRLMMTRLKPATRALLVEQGEPVLTTWRAGWGDLAPRWRVRNPEAAGAMDSLLAALPPRTREAELFCGETILGLLTHIEGASPDPARRP
ncbi:MAG TPA: hypothetical protein VIA06_08595 [Candidatus Dormibacteraeota bacterium]|nr:hypothetical protein [Candidatus Dormibacteraeota bacterium]